MRERFDWVINKQTKIQLVLGACEALALACGIMSVEPFASMEVYTRMTYVLMAVICVIGCCGLVGVIVKKLWYRGKEHAELEVKADEVLSNHSFSQQLDFVIVSWAVNVVGLALGVLAYCGLVTLNALV